jgi:hypothetical protein
MLAPKVIAKSEKRSQSFASVMGPNRYKAFANRTVPKSALPRKAT